jgi:hypothetical protein
MESIAALEMLHLGVESTATFTENNQTARTAWRGFQIFQLYIHLTKIPFYSNMSLIDLLLENRQHFPNLRMYDIQEFDELLNGSIHRFSRAFMMLESLDRLVSRQLVEFWRAPELSQYSRDEFVEFVDTWHPWPEFWEVSLSQRLRDPDRADAVFQFELNLMERYKFDYGTDRTECLQELVHLYAQAFFRVLEINRRE